LKAQALVPDSGTLRERVIGFLEQVAGLVEESTYSACMPALIDAAERDPQVRAFHCDFSAERRAVLVDVLHDAVASGDLPRDADPELLADALVGPIVMRRLMSYEPFDPKLVPALVDQILPSSATVTSHRNRKHAS
jgi:TetR/AcrR family transcriptional regulator, regulator of autoinduction and epiphytic fitness